ncbi:MAG: hypothetical protein HYS57_02760 [Parcubacteria group bacterium]|nr:hypothetical protein [Parcubacteria group bacterium]
MFYEHPETKRQIVFIATIHLAEPEYFAALQRLIESLSGYKILFEGVGKLSPQEEQALTKKERGVARDFDYIFEAVRKIGEIMSLQYQKEGLAYDSSWVNTDMQLHDLIRSFAQHDIRLLKREKDLNELFGGESAQLLTQWFINKLFSRFVPVAVIVGALAFFSRNKRLVKKFILEARNEEAVRGINEHLAEGNVAAIWGAAHMRGIEKRLKRAGFREVRHEWFTAYHIRDYSLLACLKKMIGVSKMAASTATALKKD